MQDLIIKRSELIKELNNAITELKNRGKEKAQAEKHYRMALQKEILVLRDEKYPATLISDLARGKEEIADLKFKRDCAESLYESAQQYIYLKKIELNIIEGDMEAERKGV